MASAAARPLIRKIDIGTSGLARRCSLARKAAMSTTEPANPPTVQVAGAAAEQQETAVGDQIAADHPLQVLHREAQMRPDGRGLREQQACASAGHCGRTRAR